MDSDDEKRMPMKIQDIEQKGWNFLEKYDRGSLVMDADDYKPASKFKPDESQKQLGISRF